MPQPVLAGGLMAIDGNSLNSAWTVGYSGTTSLVQRYTGGAWQVVPSPDLGILNGVLVLAPNDVWAVGDGGAMRWNGTTWTQNATFPGAMAISGLGSNDIWAVTNSTGSDNIFHWNGSQWTGFYHTDVPLNAVSPFTTDDVWAVGDTGYMARYRAPQQFEDVLLGSTFYSFVQDLSCEGIIQGYPCGGPNEPCNDPDRPYFRPQNDVTRGQLSKIVALSAGITAPFEVQTFEDVPISSTFWEYIEALAFRNAITGYPCGGPNEPCGAGNKPYFRPNATSTRGQTSKIVAVTKGYTDPFQDQTFEDVPVGSTFHTWIENLAQRGIINGYPCGGPNEPCGPDNKPYFRPGNLVTRGQMSKIAVITFFP